jgi:hypothetical protein
LGGEPAAGYLQSVPPVAEIFECVHAVLVSHECTRSAGLKILKRPGSPHGGAGGILDLKPDLASQPLRVRADQQGKASENSPAQSWRAWASAHISNILFKPSLFTLFSVETSAQPAKRVPDRKSTRDSYATSKRPPAPTWNNKINKLNLRIAAVGQIVIELPGFTCQSYLGKTPLGRP